MATLTTEQSERRSPGSSEVGLPVVGSPPNVDPPAKPKLKVSEQSRSQDATNMPLWYIHEAHIKVRQQMVTHINTLLMSRRRPEGAPESWHQKVPIMARNLEKTLLIRAGSLGEYENAQTIKDRLYSLFQEMNPQVTPPQKVNPPQQSSSSLPQLFPLQQSQVLRQQQQRLLILRHATFCPHRRNGGTVRTDNYSEGAQVAAVGYFRSDEGVGTTAKGRGINVPQGTRGVLVGDRCQTMCSVKWTGGITAGAVSPCRVAAEDGSNGDLVYVGCPIQGLQCSIFQELWGHLGSCKKDSCQVNHCVSSRSVLGHFARCQDKACGVCLPVREAIEHGKEQGEIKNALDRSGEDSKIASSDQQIHPEACPDLESDRAIKRARLHTSVQSSSSSSSSSNINRSNINRSNINRGSIDRSSLINRAREEAESTRENVIDLAMYVLESTPGFSLAVEDFGSKVQSSLSEAVLKSIRYSGGLLSLIRLFPNKLIVSPDSSSVALACQTTTRPLVSDDTYSTSEEELPFHLEFLPETGTSDICSASTSIALSSLPCQQASVSSSSTSPFADSLVESAIPPEQPLVTESHAATEHARVQVALLKTGDGDTLVQLSDAELHKMGQNMRAALVRLNCERERRRNSGIIPHQQLPHLGVDMPATRSDSSCSDDGGSSTTADIFDFESCDVNTTEIPHASVALCVLCEEAPRVARLFPCQHLCLCLCCVEKLEVPDAPWSCPLCLVRVASCAIP